MIRTICSRLWKVRRLNKKKRDDRGSSLAMVLMVMGIVAILGMLVLSTSLVTFEMKRTYSKSAGNFYDAESVMDAIRIGLMQDVADASGKAYSTTLAKYGELDEVARRQKYLESYEEALLNRLTGGYTVGLSKMYRISHLASLVPNEIVAEAVNKTSASVPLIYSTDVVTGTIGSNPEEAFGYLNQDTESGTYTLKNVQIRYVDKEDYMTEIRTDIVLSCPKVDFTQNNSQPLDLTSYVFVADKATDMTGGGNYEIAGNAYLGCYKYEESGTDVYGGATVGAGTTVTLSPNNGGGKFVTGGVLQAKGGTLNIKEGLSVWAHELLVDSAEMKTKGVLYLNDDLLLSNSRGTSTEVELGGRLYAYGNPLTASTADAFVSNLTAASDLQANPGEYSSAILLNGRKVKLDMTDLEDMILAGTAYVATGKQGNKSDVQMGESLAFKTNQRAYLVPADYVAPLYVNGGMNPMTLDSYNALTAEICSKFGYTSAIDIPALEFLRETSNAALEVPSALSSKGVKGVKVNHYTMAGGMHMVYFFLEFKTETDAINYGKNYYKDTDGKNLSSLNDRITAFDSAITYPGGMTAEFASPDEEISDYTFYYNGNMVVPELDKSKTSIVPGQCTRVSSMSEQSLAIRAREYQNSFASLSHCLNENYEATSLEERKRNVFENLVKPKMGNTGNDAKLDLGDSEKRVYSTGTSGSVVGGSQMCAVVTGGNYTLTGTDGPDNLPVRLVIAHGDVTVECAEFEGMIIAGGKVIFKNVCNKISSDSNKVQQALKLVGDNGIRPVDYLVNGERYLVDGNLAGSNGYESVDYAKYVTYKNWVKQ